MLENIVLYAHCYHSKCFLPLPFSRSQFHNCNLRHLYFTSFPLCVLCSVSPVNTYTLRGRHFCIFLCFFALYNNKHSTYFQCMQISKQSELIKKLQDNLTQCHYDLDMTRKRAEGDVSLHFVVIILLFKKCCMLVLNVIFSKICFVLITWMIACYRSSGRFISYFKYCLVHLSPFCWLALYKFGFSLVSAFMHRTIDTSNATHHKFFFHPAQFLQEFFLL